jgi:hypothetical protein
MQASAQARIPIFIVASCHGHPYQSASGPRLAFLFLANQVVRRENNYALFLLRQQINALYRGVTITMQFTLS